MKETKQNSNEDIKLENNHESKKKNNLLTEMLKKNRQKNIIIVCLILIIIIGAVLVSSNNENEISENNGVYEDEKIPIVKHNVKIHIDFIENLIFSKYDVIISVGNEEKTLTHGNNSDIEISLEEGSHTAIFTNAEDTSIKKEMQFNVDSNMEIGFKISCYSDEISVTNLYIDKDEEIADDEVEIKTDKSEFVYEDYKDVIKKLEELGFTNIVEKPMYDIVFGWTEEGTVENVTINGSDTYKRGDVFKKDTEVVVSYHLSENSDPSKIVENTEFNSTNVVNEIEPNESKPNVETNEVTYNYYTTNNNETAKKGNTGKFSYVKGNDSSYKVYWIIDFDEGYVYDFTEGNGDDTCEKIKIKSGNLNDGLELSFKNSNYAWVKYIHFKYTNQPHQLVIVDNDYFEHELSTTSLEDALKMMENKTIWEP